MQGMMARYMASLSLADWRGASSHIAPADVVVDRMLPQPTSASELRGISRDWPNAQVHNPAPGRSRDSAASLRLHQENTNGSEGVSVMDRRVWYKRGIAAAVLLMIVVLVAIASAGCGSQADAAPGPLKLGEADNGNAYAVKVGDTIEVIIPGNMTTGFSWAAALAEKDAALVQLVGAPAYATDSTLVGSGGTFTLTFKAVAKGEALLKLVYLRPWEGVAPEKTFSATVTVE